MRVAVLTCTRDRLDYTIHCHDTLTRLAGCPFDWYVVDQASEDGTVAWLEDETDARVLALSENIGLCRGLNLLLDDAMDPWDYDVIVRWDNDCELMQEGTLREIAKTAVDFDWILSPSVRGLRNPVPLLGEVQVGKYAVDETAILGGIFMVIPAGLFAEEGFRYDNGQPPWSGDELIVPWFRAEGGRAGYVREFVVNHFKTTVGQGEDIPWYFERREREGGPAL